MSILHYLLYDLFRKETDSYSNRLERNKVKKILSHNKRIPTSYHEEILKEMENMALIKIINRQFIEVLGIEVNAILDKHNTAKRMFSEGKSKTEIARELSISKHIAGKLTD